MLSEGSDGTEYKIELIDRSPLVSSSLHVLLLSIPYLLYPLAISSPSSDLPSSSPSFLLADGSDSGCLPAEIMLLILQHVNCAKTLCNLSRVNMPSLQDASPFTFVVQTSTFMFHLCADDSLVCCFSQFYSLTTKALTHVHQWRPLYLARFGTWVPKHFHQKKDVDWKVKYMFEHALVYPPTFPLFSQLNLILIHEFTAETRRTLRPWQ